MPRVGFEPTISAGERPKTYALDRAATGTGINLKYCPINISFMLQKIRIWINYGYDDTSPILNAGLYSCWICLLSNI